MAERKLIAKAFQSLYGPKEPILHDITAKRVGDSSFQIRLSSGELVEHSEGEQINDLPVGSDGSEFISGTLEVSDSGLLLLGGKSILVGERVDTRSHAIKIRSSDGVEQFLIREGEGKGASSKKAFVSQKYKDYGTLSIDQYGNLAFSDREISIPVFEKRLERNLVVFDQPGKDGKGKEAYLNMVIPGQEGGEQHGQSGVFFESWGKRPAKFCVTPRAIHKDEFSLTNDKLNSFVVAAFFPSRSPGYTSCSFRSTEDALSERYIFLKLKEEENRVKKESSMIGIPPSDHPDSRYIDHLKDKLAYLNKDCYQNEGWRITEGWSLFGAREPAAKKDSSPSFDR